jgi:hypothetical protein
VASPGSFPFRGPHHGRYHICPYQRSTRRPPSMVVRACGRRGEDAYKLGHAAIEERAHIGRRTRPLEGICGPLRDVQPSESGVRDTGEGRTCCQGGPHRPQGTWTARESGVWPHWGTVTIRERRASRGGRVGCRRGVRRSTERAAPTTREAGTPATGGGSMATGEDDI